MNEQDAIHKAHDVLLEMIKAGLMNGHTTPLNDKSGSVHADYLKALHKGLADYYKSLPDW
jgi:hypothetical protein